MFAITCTQTSDNLRLLSSQKCRQAAIGAIADLLEAQEKNIHVTNRLFKHSNALFLNTPNAGEALLAQPSVQRELRLMQIGENSCAIGLVEGGDIQRYAALDCLCLDEVIRQKSIN